MTSDSSSGPGGGPPSARVVRPCREIAILLVDPEAMFRRLLAEMLRDDEHRVLDAAHVRALPLEILQDIALVIADEHLAGDDPIAFADRVHRRRPDVPFVLTTTCRTPLLDARIATRRYVHLLEKPLEYEEVHRRVHELVG